MGNSGKFHLAFFSLFPILLPLSKCCKAKVWWGTAMRKGRLQVF